jgi:hypothetical protein
MTLSCASPSASFAQGRGAGHDKAVKSHAHKDVQGNDVRITIDRDAHVRVIHEYARSGSLPPGLARREELPPGLRKQLHEQGVLPPGLEKHLVAVPGPLVIRLPAVPSYYHRYFAGNDLLVIDSRSNRIAAIIPNVWR